MALVMSTMPDVWRKVLAEHLDDGVGRCRACRNADGETAAWPCQTYRVAEEAKWVAEGNLPGTGPHGSQGPSATPRLSPLDEPRRAGPGGASGYGDPGLRGGGDFGGFGTGGLGTGGWDLPGSRGADHPGTRGWDLPGSRGIDHPGTGGWDLPGSQGTATYPHTGGWDVPGTGSAWDLDGPTPRDPHADDAATAFGGRGTSAPALASLPPLPPTASAPPEPAPMPSTPSWRDDPLGPGPIGGDSWGRDADPEPSRHSSWHADEAAPYGSRVDAPYGSTFGVDDRPRGSRH